jgi:hypothetical protein
MTWAYALTGNRDAINTAAAAAVADGADSTLIRDALLGIGPSFDAHCTQLDREGHDRWATAIALAAVEACRRRRWSAGSVTSWVLTEVLPRLALFAEPTSRTTAGVLHAATQLTEAGDVYLWSRLLINGIRTQSSLDGPVADEKFGEISTLTAWRAGHVRMRTVALTVAATLPGHTVAACVDLPDPRLARDTIDRNRHDPTSWLDPPQAPTIALRRIGGHRAFGGPWLQLPRIVDGDGLTWQVSAGRSWTVIADAHGAAVLPSSVEATEDVAGHSVTRGRALLVSSPFSYHLVHARVGASG